MNLLQYRASRSFKVLITTLILGMLLGTLAIFAEKGNAQNDIPTLDQLKQLTQETMLDFAFSVQAKDFTRLYQNIAKLWQDQTTKDELANVFQIFFEQNIDFTIIRDLVPIFTETPLLNEQDVLILQGYYPTQPIVIYFTLKYLEQDSVWKLVGININPQEEALSGHEESVPEETETARSTQEAAEAEWERLNDEAIALYDQEQYSEALKVAQEALNIAQKVFEADHPHIADTLYNLGLLYEAQQQYEEAESYYTQALNIRQHVSERAQRAVAVSLYNLAVLHHTQQEYDKAESLYKQVLSIEENILGTEDVELVKTLDNLVNLYDTLEQYDEIEALYKRILAIQEKVFGADHLDVALTLSKMGELYNVLGEYVEAEPFHRRALLIRDKTLGSDHPEVAKSLNNLGEWHDLQERYIEAELLYQRALAIVEKTLEANDPLVEAISANLAKLYKKIGRDKESKRSTDTPESPLLRLLRFVPDRPEYQEYLTYGDTAAWHSSWNIPRITSVQELEALDRESNAYWKFIMLPQTIPPDSLGVQHLQAEDQRGFYGFDLFNLDRFIGAGQAPEGITITEFNIDTPQIANALTASGYQAETLETEGTLYSILDDYQFSLKFPTRTGRLGNLNRIALLDGQMVIAKATALVSNSLLAYHGEQPSLADNPDYVAAVKALEHPVLNDSGELVGTILMTAPNFFDPASLLGSSANEGALRLLKDYAQKPLLPPYSLVAFATRHAEGASFLILTVVFPQGTDANAAADILADRLQHYVSVAQGTPLDDRWTFEKATAVEAEGLPVVLTVMRVDDPPPAPQDASQVDANVLTWSSLIFKRDALFLIPGEIPELPGK